MRPATTRRMVATSRSNSIGVLSTARLPLPIPAAHIPLGCSQYGQVIPPKREEDTDAAGHADRIMQHAARMAARYRPSAPGEPSIRTSPNASIAAPEKKPPLHAGGA